MSWNPSKKLHIRLPDHGGSAVWEIDLGADAPTPKVVADDGFANDLMVGDSNKPDAAFRLDLSELSNTMERWVQSKRSSLRDLAVTAATPAPDVADDAHKWHADLRDRLREREERHGVQAGPHDLVFPMVRDDASGKAVVLRVVQNAVEYGPGPNPPIVALTPIAVRTVEYAPTRAAMLTLFRAGTILSFLQQTSFPIGMTCYLLNILALAGVDPDNP